MGLFDKKEKKEAVISKEVATDHVNAFLNYYDLSENDLKNKDQKDMFNVCIDKIVKAITEGRLTISEHKDGYPELTQKLRSGELLVYGILKGKSKVAMKDCEDSDMYGRIYALVGALTGVGGSAIEEIKGKDLSLAESIGFLFLKV